MDYDTNQKRIAELSEPHTPGPWVCVSCEIAHTDGSPAIARTMLAALPPGVTPEKATSADFIEVAMFVRPADARRVMASVAACSGLTIEVIESMSIQKALETSLNKLTKVFDAAQEDATWEAMREEILAFQASKTTAH